LRASNPIEGRLTRILPCSSARRFNSANYSPGSALAGQAQEKPKCIVYYFTNPNARLITTLGLFDRGQI